MPDQQSWCSLSLLVLLGAGLELHDNYPSPYFPSRGSTAADHAILDLRRHHPVDKPVGVASPGPTCAAHMESMTLAAPDVPIDRDQDEFMERLRGQEI